MCYEMLNFFERVLLKRGLKVYFNFICDNDDKIDHAGSIICWKY